MTRKGQIKLQYWILIMLRYVFLFGLILAPVASEAKPWQEMTAEEGLQARSQVEPFVHASLDCIAGAIPGNPKAVAFARKKKWIDAAIATKSACDRTAQQMVRAMDAIFEPGEGERYLRSHFRNELPGYLAKKVSLPPLPVAIPAAPRSVPAAPASTEAEEAKIKLMQALEDKHTACIRAETASLVPYSNEGAETLANVIMAKCTHVENEAADLAVAAFGYTRQGAKTVIANFMTGARQRIVNVVVTVRAEATKATRNATPPDESRHTTPSERPASSRSF